MHTLNGSGLACGRTLVAILENHQQEILNALSKDLRKPPTEALFEIIAVKVWTITGCSACFLAEE